MMPKRILNAANRTSIWVDKNARWAYQVLLVICFIAVAIFLWNQHETAKKYTRIVRQNTVLNHKTTNLVTENKHRIAEIQQEREDNAFNNCVDTNERHTHSVNVLRSIYARSRKAAIAAGREDEIPRINTSEKATTSLLDAISPVRDCNEVVKQLIPSASKNKPKPKSKDPR